MSDKDTSAILSRDISVATEMSTAYARMMVSNGYILNGGALIALPAFQDDITFITKVYCGFAVPLAFITGLIFIFFCNILCHRQAKEVEIALRNLELDQPHPAPKHKVIILSIYLTGLASYLCFIFGALLTVYLLGSSV